MDEAKQFYPIFGLGANVALVFSGRAVKYFSQVGIVGRRFEPSPVDLSVLRGAPCGSTLAKASNETSIEGRTASQVRAKLPPGVDGWGYSLKGMMGMVVIGGLLITATYFFTQRLVVPK